VYSAANNLFLHGLQFAISIILESLFFLLYVLFLPIEAVNSSGMSSYIRAMPWLPNTNDHKLLTLCWRSFSGWGNIYDMHCCSGKGRHSIVYESLPQSNTWISQDARPKIVHAPLTLIFRIGQGAYRYWFCPWRRPIHHFWLFATNCQIDYPRCKTKNRWHSVDAQVQGGVGRVSPLFLPVQMSNMSFMDVWNQWPDRLHRMQDQK